MTPILLPLALSIVNVNLEHQVMIGLSVPPDRVALVDRTPFRGPAYPEQFHWWPEAAAGAVEQGWDQQPAPVLAEVPAGIDFLSGVAEDQFEFSGAPQEDGLRLAFRWRYR